MINWIPITSLFLLENEEIKVEFENIEKLGNGAFGVVYKTKIISYTNEVILKNFPSLICAIKKIPKIPKYDNVK